MCNHTSPGPPHAASSPPRSSEISHPDSCCNNRFARICTQFLEAENIAWPTYSPDMSPNEHVWDTLDRRIRQHVPVAANIHQLRTAIEEEWTNIPQATINNLINSMRRRWVALREANGGHTRYWLDTDTPRTPPNTVKMYFLEWPA